MSLNFGVRGEPCDDPECKMERSLFANGCIVDARPTDLRASMVTDAVVSERAVPESCAKNVPFTVVSCSGQDEDFPASELNKGVVGRGWQTSRCCHYPQELVIALQFPARIINMQLLCHEYKIPSKVEIYVGLTPNSDQKRLGYFSLDPNDRSGHQARELKSIHVNSPASIVRLVLHTCYTNKLNVYNQVGLVALIITGDPLRDQQFLQHQLENSPLVQTPSTFEAASQESDSSSVSLSRSQDSSGSLAFRNQLTKVSDGNLSSVDSLTASRIRKLLQDKSAAVLQEDYDEAKRLKVLIEKLNVLGERIKELEIQKQSAVEEEDYDTAKMLKLEVENLRQAGGGHQNVTQAAGGHPNVTQAGGGHANVTQATVDNQAKTQDYRGMPESEPEEAAVAENFTAGLQAPEGNIKSMELSGAGSDLGKQNPDERNSCDQINIRQSIGNGHIPVTEQDSGPRLKQEVSVPPKQESVTKPEATRQSANGTMPVFERPPVESVQVDDLVPEPLPEAVLKELGPVISVIGKYRLECLYSKHWQLRDKTLQQLEKDMLQNRLNGDTFSAFRCLKLSPTAESNTLLKRTGQSTKSH